MTSGVDRVPAVGEVVACRALPLPARLVWVALWLPVMAPDVCPTVVVSHRDLARGAGLAVSTARAGVDALAAVGLVGVTDRFEPTQTGARRRAESAYRLHRPGACRCRNGYPLPRNGRGVLGVLGGPLPPAAIRQGPLPPFGEQVLPLATEVAGTTEAGSEASPADTPDLAALTLARYQAHATDAPTAHAPWEGHGVAPWDVAPDGPDDLGPHDLTEVGA